MTHGTSAFQRVLLPGPCIWNTFGDSLNFGIASRWVARITMTFTLSPTEFL